MVNTLDAVEETAALRWRDPTGRVHAVDSAEVIPGEVLRWTRCGLYDLPAGEGWPGDEQPTCAACRIWADVDPLSFS